MKIYRIEHKDTKLGPYQTYYTESKYKYDKLREMVTIHTNVFTHPGWYTDDLNSDWVTACACETLDKLKAWFLGYYDYLMTIGFVCVEIDICSSSVKRGLSGKQVVYNYEAPILKREIDINTGQPIN